jgi:hypothetical protein
MMGFDLYGVSPWMCDDSKRPGANQEAVRAGHRPTVSNYCQDCFVPLLCHAYLPHARECQVSTGTPVRHQPKH